MSIPLIINGVTFDYPETNDQKWGPDATGWASAITSGMLQKSGGLFQLLAEVDFGTSFGVKSLYYKSRTSNVASAGQIRLANADTIKFRNLLNDGDLAFQPGSSNAIPQWNSIDLVNISTAQTLTNKTISGPIFTGQILIASGTVGSPSLAFSAENTTGIFRPSGGTIGFSVGGSQVAQMAAAGIDISVPLRGFDGDGANPSITFANASTSGFYKFAAGSIGITTGGVVAGNISATNWTMVGTATAAAFISATANAASAGALRLANADTIKFRNSGNSADIAFGPGSSNTFASYAGIDLVNLSSAQTLTNKTLSGNTAVTLISGSGTLTLNTSGTVTLPNATDTLVGKATTDTLTNKTLSGNTAVTLISGSGTLTLNTSGTVTLPNATDTLVGKATTDTLTNKTLSGNTAVTLISGSGTLTLNTSGTVTLPNATDTLVGKATTDTMTNKTLTSPAINTPTIAGGTHTAITSLGIRDTSAAFDVTLAATSSTALTAGRTITIDVKNAARAFALQGDLTVSAAATISGTNTGDISLGAVGSAPSANGASLSAQVLTLQPADATHPGILTTGTQVITGNKTFVMAGSGRVKIQSSDNIDLIKAEDDYTFTLGNSAHLVQNSLNNLLATNGAQAATILNLPAAATSGNASGWLQITINGTTSYIPFWH